MPSRKEAEAPTTKKKSIIEEKTMKFLKTVAPDMGYNPIEKIFEVAERRITMKTGTKADVLFVTFSENGKDDEKPTGEVRILKDILYEMFKISDEVPSGKITVMDVLPPAKGDDKPALACFYEVQP